MLWYDIFSHWKVMFENKHHSLHCIAAKTHGGVPWWTHYEDIFDVEILASLKCETFSWKEEKIAFNYFQKHQSPSRKSYRNGDTTNLTSDILIIPIVTRASNLTNIWFLTAESKSLVYINHKPPQFKFEFPTLRNSWLCLSFFVPAQEQIMIFQTWLQPRCRELWNAYDLCCRLNCIAPNLSISLLCMG